MQRMGTLKYVACGVSQFWKMLSQMKSQNFTTRLNLSREGNLTANQKSTLLKPIAKALGDSIVKVTDPLANPVMSRQNSRGNKFEFALEQQIYYTFPTRL